MLRTLPIVFLALLVSACASTTARTLEVVSPGSFHGAVAGQLSLELPSGDVDIRPSNDGQLHATVRFFCDPASARCESNASEARVVHVQDGARSTLRFEPESAYATRYANIVIDIQIPRVERLDVDIPAGDLDIASPTGCLSLVAAAGDVSITAPLADTGSVELDADLGEADLRTPDGRARDERKLLVGSEVRWFDGSGDCKLTARLRAGSLQVVLE